MKIKTKRYFAVSLCLFLLVLIWLSGPAYGQEAEFTQEELDYIKEHPVVVTAVDPMFQPYEFIDSDGNYKGMAADYLKLIEIKTGLTFQILEGLTWPEAYDLALNGQVDLLPCIGITRERQNYFIFTDGYFKYQRAIFSREDSPNYEFDDLENISVGVQRNSSHYSYLSNETDIEPVLYDNTENLITALSAGEIDAIVANYASAKYLAGQLGITNIKADEVMDNETSELGMAINPDKPMLASILNKALHIISEEEKILIRNKWLGIEKEADYSQIYRYIIIGSAIAGAVILLFVFWNRSLKKLVEERKRQQEEIKKALDKVETLYKSSLALRSTVNLNEVLKVIVNELKSVVHFDLATIQEYKNSKFEIIYCEGFKYPEKIIGIQFENMKGTINYDIVNTKAPVVVPDVREIENFTDMSVGKKIRSFMAVPLIINDRVIGALALDSVKEGYYNDEMASTAEAFAAQASLALINAKNFKELEKAKAAAEQAAKAKGDFLANMSHEIRTPMNAVIGFVNLLGYTELEPKQKDYVRKIDTATKNLLTIINDILDFSKIESGKLRIESIDFSLNEVLDSLSDVLSMKAGSKGIEFIISRDESVPQELVGDPLRLEQVLLNLTNNAIKFTEEGEVIISIGLESRKKNEALIRFSVKDTGIGMTKKQISRLFSAFVQADTSTTRKYGGTGLGLSISKSLVEMMGGKIDVKSIYGKGSDFFFICPFKLSGKMEKKEKIIPSQMEGMNVLVAEDNEYAREVIYGFLKNFGLNATLASSGEEAAKEADKNEFDLCVFDYKMPGINGIEAYKRIRENAQGKLPKAILVSSYGRQELIEEAEAEGFKDVLAKPLTQSTLYNCIVNIFIETDSEKDRKEKINKGSYPEGFDKIRGASILVVEDNEINQQVAKELLEYEGFWVDIAENGQAAVDKIALHNNFDLILMDLQMPVLDGYHAARKLRNEYKTDTPIIALSADAMEGTSAATQEAGMNDYVSKPINKDELFEALVKYIKPGNRGINRGSGGAAAEDTYEAFENALTNFDVKDGLNRMGGNTGLYLKILKKFEKSNSGFASELRKAMEEKNFEECKKLLHMMKGVSGNIGAVVLNGKIKKLEHKMISSYTDGVDFSSNLEDIENELVNVLMQIGKLKEITDNNNGSDKKLKQADEADIAEKLKLLLKALMQYDTQAKQYYQELMNIDIKADRDSFEKMGDFIDDYDFDSASEMCNKILKEIAEGNSVK